MCGGKRVEKENPAGIIDRFFENKLRLSQTANTLSQASDMASPKPSQSLH
jgi:hypothetical protein